MSDNTDERRLRATRTAIRRDIRLLAREFADRLFDTLDEQGLFDDVVVRDDGSLEIGRRVRRTSDALERLCARLLEAVGKQQGPVAISAIATEVGLRPREVSHPLNMLVDEGKLVRGGERRGARYSLPPPKKKRPIGTAKRQAKAATRTRAAATTKATTARARGTSTRTKRAT